MILSRSADVDVSGDGRTLLGLAFRWDTPSQVTDDGGRTKYFEEFSQRSVAKTLTDRPVRPLFVRHSYVDGSVGEVTFSRSWEGLVFEARTSDTSYAQATLEEVNAGKLRAVSVGFAPLVNRSRTDPLKGIITVRDEIRLAELSLAERGQHDGAAVLAVRSDAGTPRLDALRRRKLLLL